MIIHRINGYEHCAHRGRTTRIGHRVFNGIGAVKVGRRRVIQRAVFIDRDRAPVHRARLCHTQGIAFDVTVVGQYDDIVYAAIFIRNNRFTDNNWGIVNRYNIDRY